MKTIGAYEAKTHFAELLEQVSLGETIIVTKRGIPVAKVIPIEQDKLDYQHILRQFQSLRTNVKSAQTSLKEMIEEGRRY
ncbi:type II toxin-antitoxin system Phd/YefM family antitoxin [Alicyclobacillus tolerans]|uniref:Antitoxin n=1 Tax=Alicyclobacillus tolerans TaxID=90970 RepID=A0A1M6WRV9_9BACL|nr:type II toxin-antitoxin system prevent-host-death family antitoxin [Alicyclobacillus montanus]SHK96490.1 prevent-host-death family protein [Alicyclobacillus montanus]